MRIKLSDHFTYGRLIRFVLPSVGMQLVMSVYGVVDGLFVSNFVGATPFAALNLIWPFIMVFATLGFMIGTGGSALVAKLLGEKNSKKANQIFSKLIYVAIGAGIIFTGVSELFMRRAAALLGAEGELLEYCVTYGRIYSLGITPFMLQNVFQSFLITAEKPRFGLWITIGAGITNMVLDALFVAVLGWGIRGAAAATVMSQIVGGIVPLIYLCLPNDSLLKVGRPDPGWGCVLKTCTNGASEFMSNVAMSVVNIVYNLQLMRLLGENGVSAYGVIMYANWILMSVLFGYAMGSAPVISFNFGADNREELHNLFKKSMIIVAVLAFVLTALAEALARPLSGIFIGYSKELLTITVRAFRIYALGFLFMGFNIFGSSFFTALNDGRTSAIISFLRAFVFQIITVLLLPLFLGVDGIWLALVVSEFLAITVTVWFIRKYRGKYHYA